MDHIIRTWSHDSFLSIFLSFFRSFVLFCEKKVSFSLGGGVVLLDAVLLGGLVSPGLDDHDRLVGFVTSAGGGGSDFLHDIVALAGEIRNI